MTPRLTMELQARKIGWAPPPRSFAADAHGCIMVPILSGSAVYKVVGALAAPTDGELASETVIGFWPQERFPRPPASLPPVLVTVKDKSLRDGPAAHP